MNILLIVFQILTLYVIYSFFMLALKYARLISLMKQIESSTLPRKEKAYLLDALETVDDYSSIKDAYQRLLREYDS